MSFNLEKALAGEFVRLRNGQKALIYYRIPDEFTFEAGDLIIYPLRGMIFGKNGKLENAGVCWKDDGSYREQTSQYDIVGMWNTLSDTINNAYENKLHVKLRDGSKAIILYKIPDKYTYHDGSRPEYVYRGAILYTNNDNPNLITEVISWRLDGKCVSLVEHKDDIIGLWED